MHDPKDPTRDGKTSLKAGKTAAAPSRAAGGALPAVDNAAGSEARTRKILQKTTGLLKADAAAVRRIGNQVGSAAEKGEVLRDQAPQAIRRKQKKAADKLAIGLKTRAAALSELDRILRRQFAERRREQEELKRAKDRAEAANLAKSEFLAGISHELRTPLSAVIGMTDLLAETELNREQRRFLRAIRSSGDSLLYLINNLLDLSKIEMGGIEFEKIPFTLMEVVRNVCEAQALQARRKEIELVWWVASEVPNHLIGDPFRLSQVLTNLVGNAVKFTRKGGVFVEIKAREAAGCAQGAAANPQAVEGAFVQLLFSISDTGIGIEPHKLESIFEMFSQADSSISREYGGTGLGLSIARHLVHMMGGGIWAESKPDEGSRFSFTARFALRPSAEAAKIPMLDLAGKRVLVIDDNAANRLVLSKMILHWGVAAQVAADGPEGIAAVRRAAAAGEPYDLILLDYRMPGMDGPEVLTRLRQDGHVAGVIIMLSSDDRKSARERCMQLGVHDYLFKPVKWSDLKEAAAAAVGSSMPPAPGRETQTTSAGQPVRPLRILLVEDNEKNRILVRGFLRKTLCRIEAAENGALGLEKFKTGRYDAVLMDIEMPVMDGYTATRAIRQWESEQGLAPTPIVALTAHALSEHRQKSLAAGCTEHLSKPIKKENLLGVIARCAQNKDDRAKSGTPEIE